MLKQSHVVTEVWGIEQARTCRLSTICTIWFLNLWSPIISLFQQSLDTIHCHSQPRNGVSWTCLTNFSQLGVLADEMWLKVQLCSWLTYCLCWVRGYVYCNFVPAWAMDVPADISKLYWTLPLPAYHVTADSDEALMLLPLGWVVQRCPHHCGWAPLLLTAQLGSQLLCHNRLMTAGTELLFNDMYKNGSETTSCCIPALSPFLGQQELQSSGLTWK